MAKFRVYVAREFKQPSESWTAPAGKVLYSGDDEMAARTAKAGFDGECDPCEGAIIERDDGMVLRGDVAEWASKGQSTFATKATRNAWDAA